MISPVEFIPLLEKSRLIIPVGEFVLNEAAKMCHENAAVYCGFQGKYQCIIYTDYAWKYGK